MMKDRPKPETIIDLQGYFCDVLGMKPAEVEQFFEFVEWKDALGARFKRFLPEGFRELAALVKGWGGEYDKDRRQFVVPKKPREAPIPSENIVEGLIERVETSTDKKWTLVYVANITRPLAIKPDLATPGLKQSNKIRAEVSIGESWMFIKRFDIPKEEGRPAEPEPAKEVPAAEIPQRLFDILPIDAILSMPFQSRTTEDPELDELAESVKVYGILEPILVRPKPSGLYEVVAGERRLKAAKKAGLTEIPVIVKDLSDEEAFVLQLTENFQRKDLTEEEKSRALAELARRTKWNAQQIADKLKRSYTWVVKYLPSEFKVEEKAEAGKLGGEARAEAYRESQDFATRRVAEPEIGKEAEIGEVPGEFIGESKEARRAEVPSVESQVLRQLVMPESGIEVGPPKDVLLDRALNWYQTDILDFVWERVNIPERRQKFLKVFSAVEHEIIVERGLLEEAWERVKTRFEKPEEITV